MDKLKPLIHLVVLLKAAMFLPFAVSADPSEIEDGYKWSGNVSSSVLIERGNSDKNEFDIKALSVWRSVRDRYTLEGLWDIDESGGEKIKDTWTLSGKHDYFLKNTDNYVGGLLRFKQDEITDLQLRTTIGPYIGYQFHETARFSLRGEIGASWVKEQFSVAEDNNYPALLWAFRLTSDIFDANIYVQHYGTIDLTEPDTLILNTTIGFGMPISKGLEVAAEIKYEYDRSAVEGVGDADESYGLRIGYKW